MLRNSPPQRCFHVCTKIQLQGSWNTSIHSTFCHILSIWWQTALKYLLLKIGKEVPVYHNTRLTQLISHAKWTEVQTMVSLSLDHPWGWQWCIPVIGFLPTCLPFEFQRYRLVSESQHRTQVGLCKMPYWSFNFPFAFLEFRSNGLNKMGTEWRAFPQ